jgi:hypothetical protein
VFVGGVEVVVAVVVVPPPPPVEPVPWLTVMSDEPLLWYPSVATIW